jgi:hypothetical protein
MAPGVDKRDRAAALWLIALLVVLLAGFMYWERVESRRMHDLMERELQQSYDDWMKTPHQVPFVPSSDGELGDYENPAPGDDGSYDCPPGGGP